MRKTLVTATALATLLLAPLPLAAQGVKGAQGNAPALTADGACTQDQRATIRRAFVDARQMTNASIAALTLEPEAIRPHLARFFGSNPPGAIAKNFRVISRGLDEREATVTYECNLEAQCRRGIFAYAGRSGRGNEVMGFCPTFFRAARTGQDSQGGIVLHEMSHLALGARDHAYQLPRVEALAKDEPAAAQMNADSYEYFAEFLPR
jgi:peptidyl-Lys metalloendopeptidase